MTVYEYNKNNWIAAWEYVNLEEKYATTYGHTTTYYDPEVHARRRELVEEYVILRTSFDYGCGKTPFYKPEEVGGAWDKYTVGFTKFNRIAWLHTESLLLFDVLEHIYDPESFLLNVPHNKCILTIPIVPGDKLESLDDIKDWKHYKPGEHFWYFTHNGFVKFVENIGWKIAYSGQNECPPRQDITSFVLYRPK